MWQKGTPATRCFLPDQKILFLAKVIAFWNFKITGKHCTRANFNRNFPKITIFGISKTIFSYHLDLLCTHVGYMVSQAILWKYPIEFLKHFPIPKCLPYLLSGVIGHFTPQSGLLCHKLKWGSWVVLISWNLNAAHFLILPPALLKIRGWNGQSGVTKNFNRNSQKLPFLEFQKLYPATFFIQSSWN